LNDNIKTKIQFNDNINKKYLLKTKDEHENKKSI